MPVTAAVYVRISRDTGAVQGLGVARQEKDCRVLAEARGWAVGEVFTENDTSAFSGKPRPEYLRMVAAVDAGVFGAIVAWDPDRLHRSPVELEAFIDTVEAHQVQVSTVQAGTVDLSSAAGRMTARVVGAVARHESEHKSERIRRKHEELAAAGKFKGGPRPYGYAKDGTTVVEAEAVVIRELARRIAAGESVRSVNAWLNDSGHLTPTGRLWRRQSMTGMLKSPRLVGRRVFRGADAGPAAWPAILDEVTHQRVVRQLTMNAAPRGRQPRYLLTGLAFCGAPGCGVLLKARPTKGIRKLGCVKEVNGLPHGCGKLAQACGPVDDLIARAVFDEFDNPRMSRALQAVPTVDEEAIVAELAGIDLRLQQYAEQAVAGTLDEVSWAAARAGLNAKAAALRTELAKAVPPAAVAWVGRGVDLRSDWEHDRIHIDEKRALVRMLIDRIEIAPDPARGGRGFREGRVHVSWR